MNDAEVKVALIHALRRAWPCPECPVGYQTEEVYSGPDERLARAIEDGDVVVKVAAEAWL